MMNTTKKKVYGFLAIALALTMVIGATVTLSQMSSNASAEAVKVSESATAVSSPFTDAVAKVKSSVVGVNNYTSASRNNSFGYGDFFGNGFGDNNGSSNSDSSSNSREVLQGSGSGVVIAQGYVLTNYHVVDGASSLEVTVDDKTYEATVAGSDENLDLAVLKVDKLDVAPVTLGDSDKLSVGDWAICIGNPLSFTGTTTVGVISALNREVASENYDQYGLRQDNNNKMIQTDAAINAGNSGGGMFNIAGELIGVPSMKFTGSYYSSTSVEGIGMAIPINVAKPLIDDVLSGKTTSASTDSTINNASSNKPRIGVTVTNMDNVSSYAVQQGILPNGAYVTDVEDGSPASTAGIQDGDIIVEADSTVITSTSQLISILQAKNAGDDVQIKLYRADGITTAKSVDDIKTGEYKEVTVELAILDNVKQ